MGWGLHRGSATERVELLRCGRRPATKGRLLLKSKASCGWCGLLLRLGW